MDYLLKVFFCSLWLFLIQPHAMASPPTDEPESRASVLARVDSLNEQAFRTKRADINKALDMLYEASALSRKYNYPKGIATGLLYEAGIYEQNGHVKTALSMYYKSLDISVANKDTFNIARARQQIGHSFSAIGNYAEARRLYNEALQGFKALGKQEDVINVKNSMGLVALRSGQHDSSIVYFEEALAASKAIHYRYGMKKSAYHSGLYYMEQKQFDRAKSFFHEALALDISRNDRYGMALSKNKLSAVALETKNYREAEDWAVSALEDAGAISALQLQFNAIENLCELYKRQNMPGKLIEWQRRLIEIQNELFEAEKAYAVNFLDIIKKKEEEQLSYEKMAVKAQQQAQYSILILVLVCLAAGALIFLTILWRKNYMRAKAYSKELLTKNEQIEESILALNELNIAISKQNVSLEQSNEMKDRLLSIISHDLRQPLLNTKGILDLIRDDNVSKEELDHLFVDLDAQFVRSLTLLDNLLFWIKGQLQRNEACFERIQLQSLVGSVAGELEIPLMKKGLALHNLIPAGIEVMGDREMLKVVFRNLLNNSIKFSEEGVIRVDAAVNNGVQVYVQDEGVGMDEKTLSKVQSKTYFTSRGTHQESGSGFGLMICRDLLKKHHGTLHIESQQGVGTLFIIALPEPGSDAKVSAEGMNLLSNA